MSVLELYFVKVITLPFYLGNDTIDTTLLARKYAPDRGFDKKRSFIEPAERNSETGQF